MVETCDVSSLISKIMSQKEKQFVASLLIPKVMSEKGLLHTCLKVNIFQGQDQEVLETSHAASWGWRLCRLANTFLTRCNILKMILSTF